MSGRILPCHWKVEIHSPTETFVSVDWTEPGAGTASGLGWVGVSLCFFVGFRRESELFVSRGPEETRGREETRGPGTRGETPRTRGTTGPTASLTSETVLTTPASKLTQHNHQYDADNHDKTVASTIIHFDFRYRDFDFLSRYGYNFPSNNGSRAASTIIHDTR